MRIKTVDISPEVADVLRRSTRDSGGLALPDGQLDRKLYQSVAKVLEALGGKWKRAAGKFMFAGDGLAQLSAALDAGHVVDQKRTLEQFFTPADVASRMVAWLDIREGMHVLEPSAGNGRLIWEALERGADIDAIELDYNLTGHLLQAAIKHSQSGKSGWLCAHKADFMVWTPPADGAPIDAVMMNPPFSRNQDIAHVTRAFGFLRPGGKLAAIMSPHFTFAEDAPSRAFRELIGAQRQLLNIDAMNEVARHHAGGLLLGSASVRSASLEYLPAGTFKAEGTNIAAVLVLIEKAL